MPLSFAILYAALLLATSIASFVAFALDKHRARTGGWRLRERTLHILCLLGGWPGGLAAMHLFRHKTIDRTFRALYFICIGLHLLALGLAVYLIYAALPAPRAT